MAARLVEQGHQCTLVVPALGTAANSLTLEEFQREVELHSTPIRRTDVADIFLHDGLLVHAVRASRDLLPELSRLLDDEQPDCALPSTEDPSQTILETCVRWCGHRVVSLINTVQMLPFGPASFFPSKRATALYNGIGGAIAVSKFCADYTAQWGNIPSQWQYLPSYGPPPFPQLGSFDNELITFVNPCAYKGISVFLSLADAFPDLRFAAVPSWGTTQSDIAELGRRENIRMLKTEQDFDVILRRTRILVMPSLWLETFGQTSVEAMLRGIPVIASNVGGLLEAKLGIDYCIPSNPIEEYTDELDENLLPVPVVPDQNLEAWSQALRALTQDRSLYERVAAEGQIAAAGFVSKIDMSAIEGFLREVSSGKASKTISYWRERLGVDHSNMPAPIVGEGSSMREIDIPLRSSIASWTPTVEVVSYYLLLQRLFDARRLPVVFWPEGADATLAAIADLSAGSEDTLESLSTKVNAAATCHALTPRVLAALRPSLRQVGPVCGIVFSSTEGVPLRDGHPGIAALDPDILLELRASGQTIEHISVSYREGFELHPDIAKIAARYPILRKQVATKPVLRVGEVLLLDADEAQTVLRDWNDTATDRPFTPVTDLFDRAVDQSPGKVAILTTGRQVTYGELGAATDAVAQSLRMRGIGEGAIVAVFQDRGIGLATTFLGILKSGAAYLPIDPALPAERVRYMLEHARPAAVIGDGAAYMPSDTGIEVLELAELVRRAPSEGQPLPTIREMQRAYVLYTSGSTGRPKGVEVCHKNLGNFVCSMAVLPGFTAQDVLLSVTTPSFDIFGLELFLPLTQGGTVVLSSRSEAMDPDSLISMMEKISVSVMQATPATWRMLIDEGWQGRNGLKVLCGGEALPLELAKQLRARCGSLWNMYGPTETTIWSTICDLPSDCQSVSIGRPIDNTTIYIVDKDQRPLPAGIRGELWIGGAGVALGYLHEPGLTAERFVRPAFCSEGELPLYRTGDLAAWTDRGQLVHHGRMDNQIKIRGYRVELGEIESIFEEHEAIAQAVVNVVERGSGSLQLVAYVRFAQKPTSGESLISWARERLPDYMVPSLVVEVEEFALTPSGKIDRKALPAPHTTEGDVDLSTFTPTEQIVARLWGDLLGALPSDPGQGFIELGGDSLLVVQMISRLRTQLDVRLRPAEIFDVRSLRAIAELIDQKLQGGSIDEGPVFELQKCPIGASPKPSGMQDLYWPVSEREQSMWIQISLAWCLRGPVKVQHLAEGFASLVQSLKVLRTGFRMGVAGLELVDLAAPTMSIFEIEAGAQAEQRARELLSEALLTKHYDVSKEVFRGALVTAGPGQCYVGLGMSHVAMDAPSFPFLQRAFFDHYRAAAQDAPPPPPPEVAFEDYLYSLQNYLKRGGRDKELRFWNQALQGIEPLDLTGGGDRRELDRKRREAPLRLPHFPTGFCHQNLDADTLSQLRDAAREVPSTPYLVALTTWFLFLQKVCNTNRLCTATPYMNRGSEEFASGIGMFVSSLLIPLTMRDDEPLQSVLKRTTESYLKAQEHPHLSLPLELDPALGRANFNYLKVQNEPISIPSLTVQPIALDLSATQKRMPTDLSLFVRELDHGLHIFMAYNQLIVEEARANDLIIGFADLLRATIEALRPRNRTSRAQ